MLATQHSDVHLHGLTPGSGSKPLRNHRDRGTDNNTHYSLFTTMDCRMLAACRFYSDKGQIENNVLTTGVNKAPFSKTFTNGGCIGSLGDFFKDRAHTSTKPKINGIFYQFGCWIIVQVESQTSMRALDSKNCNLKFTDFRGVI